MEQRFLESAASTDASPAATVVLLRNASAGLELLLVQRAAELAYHGGAWVFPGGRVEPADRESKAGELAAARQAAVREVAEEAGLTLHADDLLPFAHWTTPRGRARCFATWYFVAEVGAVEVRVDGGEIKNYRWLAPAAALALRAGGALLLPAPTFVTLTQLSAYEDPAAAIAAVSSHTPEVFSPRPHAVTGGVCSLYAGDVAYPDGEIDRPGPRHRLWMLEQGWRYERSES